MKNSLQPHIARIRAAFESIATLATGGVAVVILWMIFFGHPAGSRAASGPRKEAPLPSSPISIKGAATLGSPSARVALIQYSDYLCPFCRTFELDTLPAIKKGYVDPGNVLLVFKHFPLERLHPLALKAAEAAECARRQEKFWRMHEKLFFNQADFTESSSASYAGASDIREPAFRACMAGQATEAVRRDLEEAKRIGFRGTPGFIIGSIGLDGAVSAIRRISGAKSLNEFQKSLDVALRDVTRAR